MTTMASSAAMLPVLTLRLVGRYWAPLLCVYAAGTFLHAMMVRGLVIIAEDSVMAGLVGLSIAVLVTLTTTIVMFHLMTSGMPALNSELVNPGSKTTRTTLGEREHRVVDAVAMAILPFLIFYSAWGLFAEEFREFSLGVVNSEGLTGADKFMFEELGWPLAIAFGAWSLRAVCERVYDRTDNKWLGILTAVFEATWMFFAVFSVGEVTGNAKDWVATRVVWFEVQQAITDSMQWLENLSSLPFPETYAAALVLIAQGWEHLKEALLGPLLWLTIVSVVYGAEVDKSEPLFRKGSRADEHAQRVSSVTPKVVKGIGQFAGRDAREKYVPFLNALRFVLRVSPVFVLTFCLLYTLLDLGFGWLERGVYVLVGPDEFLGWWWPWLFPIEFAVDAVHEVLRVCLLAATFELTLRRVSTRSVGRRARRTA
ncbi:hypothetical protein CLV63_10392 [Murinocardiopsis flavida]|uniref:Uncharacterized protein n=1 Tax=Murinocardiopsis flavida TaxID=645275 RepID=A0A2P8DQ65_9ACTN|nr:hypothetical protein [Murinocardiopsis flavida]PSK99369.1 hypothetical protein CLV63_10392 [Murinocardiopsis flavida]